MKKYDPTSKIFWEFVFPYCSEEELVYFVSKNNLTTKNLITVLQKCHTSDILCAVAATRFVDMSKDRITKLIKLVKSFDDCQSLLCLVENLTISRQICYDAVVKNYDKSLLFAFIRTLFNSGLKEKLKNQLVDDYQYDPEDLKEFEDMIPLFKKKSQISCLDLIARSCNDLEFLKKIQDHWLCDIKIYNYCATKLGSEIFDVKEFDKVYLQIRQDCS